MADMTALILPDKEATKSIWVQFAQANGIPVEPGARKGDIIDACVAVQRSAIEAEQAELAEAMADQPPAPPAPVPHISALVANSNGALAVIGRTDEATRQSVFEQWDEGTLSTAGALTELSNSGMNVQGIDRMDVVDWLRAERARRDLVAERDEIMAELGFSDDDEGDPA